MLVDVLCFVTHVMCIFMQVMSSQDLQASQEAIVYCMEQDEVEDPAPPSPPPPTTPAKPLHSTRRWRRRHRKRGAKRTSPGDAPSKKNGPCPPPPLPASAAGAGKS